jgi:hypothetical protein
MYNVKNKDQKYTNPGSTVSPRLGIDKKNPNIMKMRDNNKIVSIRFFPRHIET